MTFFTRALEGYEETEWCSMSQLEQDLRNMEAQLDAQFSGTSRIPVSADAEEEGSSESEDDRLYCVACDKCFKSDKA